MENIQVKEVEMENLAEALVRSKKMVSELRTCHVSSVTHQQEIELRFASVYLPPSSSTLR